ncbi:MAG: MoaD/ThiS family protein [Dehalococcoidia bacterium]
MTVTILLFASVADAAGTRRLELPLSGGERVGQVRDRLFERYPALVRFGPTLMYALDEEYATIESPVHDGAVLALIPPVSGG